MQELPLNSEKPNEIEIKLSLPTDRIEYIHDQLLDLGFSKPTELPVETDIYFDGKDFIEQKICLRLRKRGDFCELTYKGPSNSRNTELGIFSKAEENIPIDCNFILNVQNLLTALGHKKLVEVSKKRALYEKVIDNEKVVIAIDEVASIGHFVEIEIVSHNISKARQLIQNLQNQLNLKNVVHLPYRDLVLNATKK